MPRGAGLLWPTRAATSFAQPLELRIEQSTGRHQARMKLAEHDAYFRHRLALLMIGTPANPISGQIADAALGQ